MGNEQPPLSKLDRVIKAGRGLATALEEVVAHPEAPREELEHIRDEALARWIVAVADARGEVER